MSPKKKGRKPPLRKKLVNKLRRAYGEVRRFLTLEPRPEDIRLRRTVEELLAGDDGIQFTPWRYVEKQLREALRTDREVRDDRDRKDALRKKRR
jgi:hypothetical protein